MQPLVENAVVHGFEKHGRGGKIILSAKVVGDILWIEILDNGGGMDEYRLAEIQNSLRPDAEDVQSSVMDTSIGLKNVNTRLKLFYGSSYGLIIIYIR